MHGVFTDFSLLDLSQHLHLVYFYSPTNYNSINELCLCNTTKLFMQQWIQVQVYYPIHWHIETRPSSRAKIGQKTVGRQLLGRHTSHMSMATWQLSRTTAGESSRFSHSWRMGSTSGVPIPPNASAASCRTISDSWLSASLSTRHGTECGDRSWPNTKAISCLRMSQHSNSLE